MLVGRVVRVRPREDGSYAVTVGTGRRTVYWLRAAEPLRVGDLVRLTNEHVREGAVSGSLSPATLCIVDSADVEVVPDRFSRRLVGPGWLRRAARSMRRPLFPHQAEGAAWLAERLAQGHGAILADEMGLGKTSTAIAALCAARALPAIVVCPATLKTNWQDEIRYTRQPLRVAVVDGLTGPLPASHVLVVNYDVLRAREAALRLAGAKALVLDESQAVKEPLVQDSHRAAVATRIARSVHRVVLLTGTPLLNRLPELWRMLQLVDPDRWPDYEAFRARYCVAGDGQDALSTEHGSVSHLDELHCYVDEVMLRRTKQSLLTRLPPKRRSSIEVELPPRDRAHYDAAERDVKRWLRSVGKTAEALTAAKGETLVKLTMLRHIAARGKVRAAVPGLLRSWAEAHAGEPLVVFGYHVDVLAAVRLLAHRAGLTTSLIGGSQGRHRRQVELDRWQCGASQILVASVRVGGLGLNLQRAHHALVLERLWSPGWMEQAEDRLHRIGQTWAVTITYLDALRTVDAYLAEVLRDKSRIIRAVVDGDASSRSACAEDGLALEVARRMADDPTA
jgi:SNF2 family DNA or RNA helicase